MDHHAVDHVINSYRKQIRELQEELKTERRNFDLLEKSVDQSYDSEKIYRRFHKYREEDLIK